jgi:hypothetical protein
MRHKLILAGLLAAVAAPSLALAQPDPGCVRSNNATTGTGVVLGALGGALIGNAIGGRHSRGTDTALGAVAGGVAGGALANQHNDPCPQGYYRPAPPPPAYGPGYGPPPPQGVGFWRGAPVGIHERIDFLNNRIGQARANGWLGRHDAEAAYGELNDIRRQEHDMRYRDGGHLYPQDRDYLQSRLDNLSRRIHWESHGG